MPEEFRYPLTRYCLRGGALTLPRAMVGLFPAGGEVTALDTLSETEHRLKVADARTVLGLGPLFKEHRLAVNDELLIRRLEDGRFAITPLKREHKPDYSSREAIRAVLDDLIAASVPVTEAEVRALYPGIPGDVALDEALAADERFVQREGRWHNALSLAYPPQPIPSPASEPPAATARGAARPLGHGEPVARGDGEADGDAYASVGAREGSGAALEAGAAAATAEGGAGHDRAYDRAHDERARDLRLNDSGAYAEGAFASAAHAAQAGGQAQPAPQEWAGAAEASQLDAGAQQLAQPAWPVAGAAAGPQEPGSMELQAGLWQDAATSGGAAGATASSAPLAGPGSAAHGREAGRGATVLERRRPENGQGRGERVVERREDEAPTHAGGRLEESDDLDDGASLEITELANRLRAVMAPVGFRLEPVARGQLNLVADMGRQGYTVLVQLVTRNERLDWADLLARRRASNVRYLAVVGDQRALLRLLNPAQLARATLWSWQALERLATLQRTVAVSPVELQSHFERDGLFEKGLERFEAAVAKRVAERGAMSELLTRLAAMRAPTVFLLEDLTGELDLPRDRLLRLLELLGEAPFHLIAKVDQGEFVLRQRVPDALTGLASYATSLRERLPGKQVERLTGLAEPDLLTEAELDDQPN